MGRHYQNEAALQRKIQSLIRDRGCYVFKNNGNVFTEVGRPDLVACIPIKKDDLINLIKDGNIWKGDSVGIFLGLEVKQENLLNNISEAQAIVGKNIIKAGGIWYPVDNAEFVEGMLYMLKGEKE